MHNANKPLSTAEPNAFAQEIASYRWSKIQTHLFETQSEREGDAGEHVLIAREEQEGKEGEAEKHGVVSVAMSTDSENAKATDWK